MSKFNLKVFIAFLLAFPYLNACTTVQLPNEEPFLASPTDFFEYPEVPEFFVLYKATPPLNTYKKVIIEHPLISINAQDGWHFANPNFLKFIADTLYREVAKTLKTDFKLAKATGPDTLRIRLVINKLALPNHRVSIASTSAGLIPVGLNNTVLEAYFEDSLTDELYGGIRDLRIGHKSSLKFLYGFVSPLYVQKTFDLWSNDLLSILQENFKLKEKSQDYISPIVNSKLNNNGLKNTEKAIIESVTQKEIGEREEEQSNITPPPSDEIVLPFSPESNEHQLETYRDIDNFLEQPQIENLSPSTDETVLPSDSESDDVKLETYRDIDYLLDESPINNPLDPYDEEILPYSPEPADAKLETYRDIDYLLED